MDDRYDPNLILAYVEDELLAADRARVEAMLAEDPAFAALVADMQRNRETLRGATPIEPPADLAEGAMAAIERQMLLEDTSPGVSPPPPPPKPFRIAPYLTYGGIAAVLAITATVVFQSLQSDQQPASTIAMSETPLPGQSLAEATLEAQRKAMREFDAETPAAEPEVLAADTAVPAEEALAMAELAERTSLRSKERDDPASGFGGDPFGGDPYGGRGFGGAGDVADAFGGASATARDEPKRLDAKTAAASTPEPITQPPALLSTAPLPVMPATAGENELSDASPLAESVTAERGGEAATASLVLTLSEPETPLARAAAQETDPVYGEKEHLTSLQAQTFAQVARNPIMLNVATRSPERSLQQVNDWAFSNRIQVASLPADFSDVPLAVPAEVVSVEDTSPRPALPMDQDMAWKLGVDEKREAAQHLDEQPAVQYEVPAQLGRQRLQLKANAQQLGELVAALSEPDVRVEPASEPWSFSPAWMEWQSILQPAEVEIIIEPVRASERSDDRPRLQLP
ncbi:MAG: hypothetical protein AAGA25_11990 [Planctomycetota bacterium]